MLAKLAPVAIAMCFAVLPATADAAAKPYNGTWTVFSPQCGGDDGELEIRGTYWGEVDAVCRIRSVTGGRGVWTFKLDRCQGEGVKRTQQVTVFVSGNRLTTLYRGNSRRTNFSRCR